MKDARSFFVGVDPFDPIDAYAAPPFYVRPGRVEDDGLGPTDGRMVSLDFSDKDIDRVREAYVAHVEAVDDELGKLLDAVPDDTALFVLGDHGLALGEHGYMGRAAPTSHRLSYEMPYLIRHPSGQNAGDHIAGTRPRTTWPPRPCRSSASPIPGKMDGEDLTALFDDVDQWDLPKREKVITAVGSQIVIRDNRWLVVADRQRTVRRMYDDDEDVDDDDQALRQHRGQGHRQAQRALAICRTGRGRNGPGVRAERSGAAEARGRQRRHRQRRHPERLRPVRQRAPAGRRHEEGPPVRRPLRRRAARCTR